MEAYADESSRQRYLMAAVLIDRADLDRTRKVLRTPRKPGQRRVHFTKESDPRRRMIVSSLLDLGLRARVYESDGPKVTARAACLGQMTDDMLTLGVDRLVLETLEGQEAADRRTVFEWLQRAGGTLSYEHKRAYEEPLLWVADAGGLVLRRGRRLAAAHQADPRPKDPGQREARPHHRPEKSRAHFPGLVPWTYQ